MNDGKVTAEIKHCFLPELDPAVRYHGIKESNGRVSMEVVMHNQSIKVELTCCACQKKTYLSALEFAGREWRNRKPFNDFLQAHKDCTGPVKQFTTVTEPKTATEEEGRVFRGDE